MTQANSRWQTEELATAFLQGVRGAIPGADLQLAVLGKIVQLWCESPPVILDLGCGDGILGRYLLGRLLGAKGVFADFSDPMLKAAKAATADLPQATVVSADFSTPAWIKSVGEYGPFDVIVSGFAIHHQPDLRKQEIYREVFQLLTPGGIFLNLEHVASLTPAGERLFDEFFIDHLHQFHDRTSPEKSREDVADTYYRRPDKQENILAPVEVQCQWLRHIGFTDVDCFFKTFELALFGGRKLSRGD
jgi:SAM-dependent methyltransferase